MRKALLFLTFLLPIQLMGSIYHTVNYNPDMLSINVEENDSVTLVQYEGLSNTCTEGFESVPEQFFTFSLPYNSCDLSISYAVDHEYDFILDYPIKKIKIEDNELYKELCNIPTCEDVVCICQAGYSYGSNRYVIIRVRPVVATNSGLKLFGNVKFEINWDLTDDESELNITPTNNIHTYNEGLEQTKNLVLNPQDVELNAPKVVNPHTSDMEEYEYIIITTEHLYNGALRLASMRRTMGFGAKVFNINEALRQFPDGDPRGFKDEAGSLKEFIKYCYRTFGTKHVLLIGKFPEIPIRKIAVSPYSSNYYQYPTDFYFAEFNTLWTPIGQECATIQFTMDPQFIDFYCEVTIGRLPAESVEELNNYIDKLKIYEWNPGNGDYSYLSKGFTTRLDDSAPYGNGAFKDYCTDEVLSSYTSLFSAGNYVEVQCGPGKYPGAYIIHLMNENPSVIQNFLGHGHPGGISVGYNNQWKSYGVLALENKTGDEKQNWSLYAESGNGLDNLNNKYTPGWAHCVSCTTMPFDIFIEEENGVPIKTYDVTKNFGESYILGKNYGGVAFIGNTRVSYASSNHIIIPFVYNKVKDCYFPKDGYPITIGTRLYSGDLTAGIYNLSEFNSPSYYNKLMQNLFGDPLTELRFGTPIQFTISEQGKNAYVIFSTEQSNAQWCQISRVPLSDATYAYRTQQLLQKNRLVITYPNEVAMVSAPNSIPKVLPLHIQNMVFDSNSTSFIFADKIFIEKGDYSNAADKVVFSSNSDVTIESLSDVIIDLGTVFESGSKLTINAANEVNMFGITIPSGSTLIINAPKIVYGEDRVTFHPNSTVILNGKRITNGQSRARRNQDYDSLIQEGKTFWYAQNDKYNVTTEGVFGRYEYGFRIGKEVELDNLTWHEVVLCRCAYADVSGVISRVADSDQLVGYVREENKQVFVKDIFYNHNVAGWQPGVLGLNEVFYDDVHTYKLYDFNPQAQEVELGNDEAKVKLYLNAVERNDDDRNVYTFRYSSFSNRHGSSFPTDLPLLKPGDEIQLVEGVGYIFTTETSIGLRHLSELFFAPFGCDMTSAWPIEYPYELRYVTDGDGNILYEATGGIKLWKYTPSGVEDVSIDFTANAQWYTLGGVQIKAPAVPGVYILRIGNKAEKIAIQ